MHTSCALSTTTRTAHCPSTHTDANTHAPTNTHTHTRTSQNGFQWTSYFLEKDKAGV